MSKLYYWDCKSQTWNEVLNGIEFHNNGESINIRKMKYWYQNQWNEHFLESFKLYNTNPSVGKIYALNPETLATIRSFTGIGSAPNGIGGTQHRLYHTDYSMNKIYELNTGSLAALVTVTPPGNYTKGIGGTRDNKLYYCSSTAGKNYRLHPDTFAVLTSNSIPGSSGQGLGAMGNQVFASDFIEDSVYELNPFNLSTIKVVETNNDFFSIGGTLENLYATISDMSGKHVSQVNSNTFASIKSISATDGYAYGIGGIKK